MKTLGQLFATLLLALAINVSVYAGDMQTPTITSPYPPPAIGNISSPAVFAGGMSTPGFADILLAVLSLF